MTNQLFMILLILVGVWLVIDEIYGTKKISSFVGKLTGGGATSGSATAKPNAPSAPSVPNGRVVV